MDGDCGREEGGWTDCPPPSSSSPVAVNTRPPLPPSLPFSPLANLENYSKLSSLTTIYKEKDYKNVVMEISFQTNEIMREI